MLESAGAIGMFKTIASWLLLPFSFLLGVLGWNLKRQVFRLDALEKDVIEIRIALAKNEVYIQDLSVQLKEIDLKLENILNKLL